MIWKLLHLLFGFDYIQWRNSADQGVARVYRDHSGRVYYWRYRNIRLADEVNDPREVLWLTCPPEKFFPHLMCLKVIEQQ